MLGSDIKTNLLAIQADIRAAEQRYQRAPHSVRLLAVSKQQSVAALQQAYAAGQSAFGENYLQEALTKITALKDLPIEWHFIGSIQSNKTKKIAENFHWVHTVSDLKTAARLNDQRPATLPPLNICLQVNSSLDANKSGAHPDQLLELATECQRFSRLHLRGIMSIPTEKNIFTEQREECHKVYLLWQNLRKKHIKMDTLSLGMSNDLDAAIAEGSTMVRIGTKIFGYR